MKSGIVRGKQRYYCKDCKIYFTFNTDVPENLSVKNGEVTVKDIAKSLGISISTVSRALKNSLDVSAETREQVLNKARELDYLPNDLALALSTKKTNRIGIIVPEISYHFFPKVINAASEILVAQNYNVLIANTNNHYDLEVSNARNFLSSRVEGLLVSVSSETNNFDHFTSFIKRNIPIVFFNRVPLNIDAPKIMVNDFEAATKIVTHLIKQGYTRIAHIAGPPNLLISKERLRGYERALQSHNMSYDKKLVVHSDSLPDSAVRLTKKLMSMKDKPDAIFCFNDPIAVDVIVTAKALNIKIPSQLGVAGFSDEPVSAYIEPSLTTVHHPLEAMGIMAAETLLQQITTGIVQSSYSQILDSKIIIRDSTKRNPKK